MEDEVHKYYEDKINQIESAARLGMLIALIVGLLLGAIATFIILNIII